MKKYFILLILGAALVGCKENPERESLIREYYRCQLKADSAYAELVELGNLVEHVRDSLEAINEDYYYNSRYNNVHTRWVFAGENWDSWRELRNSYYELQELSKTFWDRNYFKIYEKELKEQGRLKE